MFRSQRFRRKAVGGLRRRRPRGTRMPHPRTPNIPYACRTQERNPNRVTELSRFISGNFPRFIFRFLSGFISGIFPEKIPRIFRERFPEKAREIPPGLFHGKTDQTIPKPMTESVDDGTDRYVRHRHDGKSRRNFSTRSCTRMSMCIRVPRTPHTKRKPRRSAEVFRKLLL